MNDLRTVHIVGGGLAGSEAAWQLAQRGIDVTLYEMRPAVTTPAHHGKDLAELVCSNSLKSDDPKTASGLLKRELDALGSLLISVARKHRVAAGAALAVDREGFSAEVTRAIEQHPRIQLVREEVRCINPDVPTIVAAGPLASDCLSQSLTDIVGGSRLHFYDAAAPIVMASSLNPSRVFAASRWGKGSGDDYLNIALDEDEYRRFYDELISARRVIAKDFERSELFAACQPVEEVARTGFDALRYGALKPVGIDDPRTGRWPFALVQLRAETADRQAYNLVGFQTNLTWPEQRRVFALLPGLENAEFARFGVMHRNTFVDAPSVLNPDLSVRGVENLWLSGQITGTEGYLEAVASGLLAGLNVFARITGRAAVTLPRESAFGSLVSYATSPETARYQPMHVNYGIIPALPQRVKSKQDRYAAYSERARAAIHELVASRPDIWPQ